MRLDQAAERLRCRGHVLAVLASAIRTAFAVL